MNIQNPNMLKNKKSFVHKEGCCLQLSKNECSIYYYLLGYSCLGEQSIAYTAEQLDLFRPAWVNKSKWTFNW